jgi:hypothetical protein
MKIGSQRPGRRADLGRRERPSRTRTCGLLLRREAPLSAALTCDSQASAERNCHWQ